MEDDVTCMKKENKFKQMPKTKSYGVKTNLQLCLNLGAEPNSLFMKRIVSEKQLKDYGTSLIHPTSTCDHI